MRKRLNEAIPGLKLDTELEKAVSEMWVESISHSEALSEIRIIISSDRPVCASVYSLEEIIKRQIFKDEDITIRLVMKAPDVETARDAACSAASSGVSAADKSPAKKKSKEAGLLYGASTEGNVISIEQIEGEMDEAVVEGTLFKAEERETKKGGCLFTFAITDRTDSISGKIFSQPHKADRIRSFLVPGATLRIKASVEYDSYGHEIALAHIRGIREIKKDVSERADTASVKRVELHCHTKMSDMDAVTDVSDILKRAAQWGHRALAITDHGVVQAFPDAANTKLPNDFKIIYGMEGYLVDDLSDLITNAGDKTFQDRFVVFDIETTGLNKSSDEIIEIGAVKISEGKITDRFSEFVKPSEKISRRISELTHIENYMLEDADDISRVMPRFLDFAGDAVLVAHNASFDIAFIAREAKKFGFKFDPSVVDTMTLARMLIKDAKRFTLDAVAKKVGVRLVGHHRAVNDAEATAGIFLKFIAMFRKQGITTLKEANAAAEGCADLVKKAKSYHVILIAKNDLGRVNLYRLVTLSHLKYFYRKPRIPKSELIKYREGIIVGSACSSGELFSAVHDGEAEETIRDIASFYDYLEIQPAENNIFMIDSEKSAVSSVEDIKNINRRIAALGDELKKPVCATSDAHFLDPEDEIYRRIIMYGMGYQDADNQPPLYLRTTDEMLEEFSYLGEKKAFEAVVENTNKIADMCEPISPVRPDRNPPAIEKSDETLRKLCYETARKWYGDNIPDIVKDRLEMELNSIISNGYAVMYIIAWKLVTRSKEDGYLVGSRGSVGSSLVATMAAITEVNPLPPHYRCPVCKHSDFTDPACAENALGAGCDMPDKTCPVCGSKMIKDGFDIPFETFLGFKGEKEPDIDLNFSGDYQPRAHAMAEEIFGKGQTFRAGTITTIAEKTAFGFVKKYSEQHGENKRSCEIDRLSLGCTGVRRSTGQHPGGIIVLPYKEDINTFTPVQHPANDMQTNIITTHFDYHKIEQNLLKLDLLGHDDPTMIKKLMDLTGVDATKIPLDDEKVMSLFKGTEALGVKPEDIGGCPLGVLGVPEFGTDFAMQMLIEAGPQNFADLVRVTGLAHGENVWLGNARDLILDGQATLKTAICTRDDIMLYLISMGIKTSLAFDIMEKIRKGIIARKGEPRWAEWKKEMEAHGVPAWYIDSCEKIKYMFPKAHAAAYVMMAWRVAWFKINRPLEYYTAFFTIRASAFSYELMCMGKDVLESNLIKLKAKTEKLTQREEVLIRNMRIAQEMLARGFTFCPIDIYKADAANFTIVDGKIMPSLSSIDGMGEKAAESLKSAARESEFLSIDDLRERAKISQSLIDKMDELGLLGSIPKTNQYSFFDMGLLS